MKKRGLSSRIMSVLLSLMMLLSLLPTVIAIVCTIGILAPIVPS